jgi:8-oxo-dGTP pyrophosphatase MutT (NUDIX family)
MAVDWKNRLTRAVTPLDSGVSGLQVMSYRPPDEADIRPGKTAAVLVPILDKDDPEIVLTRRADHLPTHPGQVSFPGGAMESQDRSAVHTAVREAHEEIGLDPGGVTPVGFLDRLDTISDYRVLPVVAVVSQPRRWRLDFEEVAEVFTVPLDVVTDRQRYMAQTVVRGNHEAELYSMQWQGQNIWGATARILINLIDRLDSIDD